MLSGAIWRSQKLKQVQPPRFRAEFANLVPLVCCNGTFECDPELVYSTVYSFNRPDISLDDVRAMLDEFARVGMLCRWREADGKEWGYFIGAHISPRLQPPSERKKASDRGALVRFDKLCEYMGPTAFNEYKFRCPTLELDGTKDKVIPLERKPAATSTSSRTRNDFD